MTIDLTADERERVLNILAQMQRNLAADRLADAVEAALVCTIEAHPRPTGSLTCPYCERDLAAALVAYRETTKSPG